MILDVDLDRGFFFLLLRNIGTEPAVDVVTTFGPTILGLDGKQEINGLNLFRGVTFFAPGKTFCIFLGAAANYFATKQSTKFSVQITYAGEDGTAYEEAIIHDLEIYRDLPHEVKRDKA